ncbi:MAG: hypothetical protein IPL20_10070 [Saprospiraceae bacterium]|nr:hypothetical protein [Saprospiraceae bacterium]
MIEENIEIPKFFKHDYDLILSVIDSPLQPFSYKTSFVSILRFEYYKEFWNSPIDKKLFTQRLKKIVNIFNEIFCLDDIYLCDVNTKRFKLQKDKQIFLDKVKLSFLDPEILAVVYFKRTNVIFVVNYDLSLVLFYEKRLKSLEKIINIFKQNGLDFII